MSNLPPEEMRAFRCVNPELQWIEDSKADLARREAAQTNPPVGQQGQDAQTKECGFCKGKPVGNVCSAGALLDGKAEA